MSKNTSISQSLAIALQKSASLKRTKKAGLENLTFDKNKGMIGGAAGGIAGALAGYLGTSSKGYSEDPAENARQAKSSKVRNAVLLGLTGAGAGALYGVGMKGSEIPKAPITSVSVPSGGDNSLSSVSPSSKKSPPKSEFKPSGDIPKGTQPDRAPPPLSPVKDTGLGTAPSEGVPIANPGLMGEMGLQNTKVQNMAGDAARGLDIMNGNPDDYALKQLKEILPGLSKEDQTRLLAQVGAKARVSEYESKVKGGQPLQTPDQLMSPEDAQKAKELAASRERDLAGKADSARKAKEEAAAKAKLDKAEAFAMQAATLSPTTKAPAPAPKRYYSSKPDVATEFPKLSQKINELSFLLKTEKNPNARAALEAANAQMKELNDWSQGRIK